MCPEARARMTIPVSVMTRPKKSEVQSGVANQKYAAAKTKPSGTRERVAIRAQLGITASQQVAGRGDHFFRRDLEQPGLSFTMMRKGGFTLRMAQRNRPCAKWPSPRRISWAE